MRTTLKRRLSQLEKTLVRAAPAPVESARSKIMGWLDACGIVVGPKESGAEATARAMGIDCIRLVDLLQRRAAGEDLTTDMFR